ncbi:MAG: peptidoglycan bridge formation glycyltransferase FemA/FemB family protein [Anaerolineae bacterium]|jgi:peptidoglycan pentaglycine glycine transferase (the first glycine)|nr:peptidoglycan bridge formation glycyltransferase FemA/FemB family protein [Anaerolineae bacterium]MBT7074635.1 peptidoglycan bridge formation glycyltransferase FemA/FemB family protein [Anaerolineae bacterium]MBT7782854.1 peptidoglycan bridge formation glycyltransferase FemA/FemB family protein [Anaerolineae bacterium]
MKPYTGSDWNTLIVQLPNPHFLQTREWSEVKEKNGWEPMPYVWYEGEKLVATAMILKRALPIRGFAARLSVFYIPKGPLMDWENESLCERVLGDLQEFAKKQGAIFLKIDPDVVLGTGIPESEDEQIHPVGQKLQSELRARGWRYSDDQIQFRNTVLVDLQEDEEEILMRMKSKTRYNIRLAGRKGVSVRVGAPDDWAMLYKIYAETSIRDGFAIRDEEYYKTVWQTFNLEPLTLNLPTCEPLIAEVEGEPVAAIFVFYFAERAYYVYGMSTTNHRNKMPTYLLQWEAMKRAKERDCTVYDLWGAPEIFDESDDMWGVFRFKSGLGGEVVRTLGAWDYAPNPLWYKLYTELIPRVLNVMRSRGKKRTRENLT